MPRPAGNERDQVGTESSCSPWSRPHCSALDKFGLGKGLAAVGFAATDVGRPSDDAADDGLGIPANVGYGRFGPSKSRIGITAYDGDVARHAESPGGSKLQDRIEDDRLIANEGRGGGELEQ